MSNDRITELLEEILAELKRQNTPYPSLRQMPAPYYPPEWWGVIPPAVPIASFDVTTTSDSTVRGLRSPEVQG